MAICLNIEYCDNRENLIKFLKEYIEVLKYWKMILIMINGVSNIIFCFTHIIYIIYLTHNHHNLSLHRNKSLCTCVLI